MLPGPTRDLLGEPFRLDSISEVAAPEGAEGLWQQYVIVQGTNTIKGLRAGTHAEVNVQVESMVERLNERFRKSQTGLAGSTGRKPPPRVGRQDAAARTPPAAVVSHAAGRHDQHHRFDEPGAVEGFLDLLVAEHRRRSRRARLWLSTRILSESLTRTR